VKPNETDDLLRKLEEDAALLNRKLKEEAQKKALDRMPSKITKKPAPKSRGARFKPERKPEQKPRPKPRPKPIPTLVVPPVDFDRLSPSDKAKVLTTAADYKEELQKAKGKEEIPSTRPVTKAAPKSKGARLFPATSQNLRNAKGQFISKKKADV
jgi:hypothetical protein